MGCGRPSRSARLPGAGGALQAGVEPLKRALAAAAAGAAPGPGPGPSCPSDSPCRCWQGVEDGVGRSSSWAQWAEKRGSRRRLSTRPSLQDRQAHAAAGPPTPAPGITPQLGMGARPAELQSRRGPEQGADTRPLCPPPGTERLCTVQASQRPWESRRRLAGGSQSRFLLLRDLFCPGCSAPTLPGATSRNGNCVGPHSTGCCSVEGRPRARRSPNH